MTDKTTWFIITSNEIEKIQEYLSGIKRDLPERDHESAEEISRIIKIVEQRLA